MQHEDPYRWSDLRPQHGRLLAFGALTMFASGMGQTYFISFFGEELRGAFGLSDATYGLAYGVATLLSGFLLMQTTKLTDTVPLGRLSLGVALGAVLGTLVMAGAQNAFMLALAFLLLRHFGQGLMGVVVSISLTRYFEAFKGRAMGLAMAGFSVGELLLPFAAVGLSLAFGWRGAFLGFGLFLLLAYIPIIRRLLSDHGERHAAWEVHVAAQEGEPDLPGSRRRQWQLREVIQDWRFYCILPTILAMPAIFTALFLHMESFIEHRDWPQAVWVQFWALYPLVVLVTANLAGDLIDRLTAVRVLPFCLLPFAIGLLVLVSFEQAASLAFFLACLGISAGLVNTASVTVWPELYGVKHLGDVRRFTTALTVSASALGPIMLGVLLSLNLSFEVQFASAAVFMLVAQVLAGWVAWRSPVRALRRVTPYPR